MVENRAAGIGNQVGTRRMGGFVPWWRRSYLVDRELQFRYGLSGIVVGLVSSLLSVGQVLWAFRVFHIWQGQRLPAPVIAGIVLVLVINVVLIFAVTVLMTHRIAGPIYNLVRQFQRLSDGDFTIRAKFRSSDELQKVAESFNELVERLHHRDEEIQAKVAQALKACEDGDIEGAKSVLGSLRSLPMHDVRTPGT